MCSRFRPLAGSKISELAYTTIAIQRKVCFRPLTGSEVSERRGNLGNRNLRGVSVPSRGVGHLNINSLDHEKEYFSFRPLLGSMVSELSKTVDPWGEVEVSVPSRGIRYLNSISCAC